MNEKTKIFLTSFGFMMAGVALMVLSRNVQLTQELVDLARDV